MTSTIKRLYKAEQKEKLVLRQLKLSEPLKVKCGSAHFEELENADYKVVSEAWHLID